MRLAVFLLVGVVVPGFLGACSGAHESRHDIAATTAASLSDTPRLDVASLLQLSIDEVSRRVGQPHPVPPAFDDPTLIAQARPGEAADSTALFQYQGLNLVVTYNHGTRRVKDLMIMGSNEDELMNLGQLQLGASQYLVLPVFQKHRPTELMGLRVLATNTRR